MPKNKKVRHAGEQPATTSSDSGHPILDLHTPPAINLPDLAESGHPEQAPSESVTSVISGEADILVSRKACSTFCAGTDGIDLWLAERYAYRIRCEEINDKSPVCNVIRDIGEVQNINSRVKEYQDMCQSQLIRWPSEWKAIADMPNLPDVYTSTGAMKYLYKHRGDLDKDFKTDAPEGFKNVLVPHFHDLCNSVIVAAVHQRFQDSENRVVPEAQVRHAWDNLVTYFSGSGKDGNFLVSLDAYFEKQLNCSCNEMIAKLGQDQSALRVKVKGALKFSYEYWTAMDQHSTTAREALDIYDAQSSIKEDNVMVKATQTQAMREPMTGKCDFIVCQPILADSLIKLLGPNNAEPARKFLDSAKLVIDKFIGKQLKHPQAHLQVPSQPSAAATTSETKLRHLKELNIPSMGEIASLLPLVVGEYKKDSGEDAVSRKQAENQATIYCVSSVAFLGHLGIKDFLVYGLVGLGQEGRVIAAWKSSITDRTYILNENVRTFVLHNSVDAFDLAFFLWRVRNENGPKLQNVFEKCIAKMIDSGDYERSGWTKAAEDERNAYRQRIIERAKKEKKEKDQQKVGKQGKKGGTVKSKSGEGGS